MIVTSEKIEDFVRTIPDFPKPGISFKDITPILLNPPIFRQAIRDLAEPFAQEGVNYVLSAEARGFIFGPPVALELNAGFIPLRKPGKLPGDTVKESYDLEYGSDSLEIHTGHLPKGSRVLLLDDVLATGGTMAAASKLAEKLGAIVIGFSFLIELSFLNGIDKLKGKKVFSRIKYD